MELIAAPNVSEGRDARAIEAIGAAFASTGAELLDVHSDADHHRSVFTLRAGPGALAHALQAGARETVRRVDLTTPRGSHPHVGALDVAPVVFLEPEHRGAACAEALLTADLLAELGLPVFLYGELAPDRGPAFFRRGGPEELQRRIDAGEVEPDFGPGRLHEAAGGVIVGARRPLIAFNVNLADANVEAAKAIARVIRERDGGFPGVRALGLDLLEAGHAQVSMNVEDWEASALHEIVEAIEREAAVQGVEVAGAELVGLMPAGAAASAAGAALRIEGFDASRLLELRLLDGS